MIIKLTVKPRSSKRKIIPVNHTNQEYIAYIHSPPVDGKANQELIILLSEFFKVPKSKIHFKTGINSRHKIIEIID
ncbi:MAG: hypothetical protein KatS3mg129_0089 [Leptospiraceae bacterium]|nr:MAG: hypothetical protein KatS3mg129_0089 [Leptospiraceae bacterium]